MVVVVVVQEQGVVVKHASLYARVCTVRQSGAGGTKRRRKHVLACDSVWLCTYHNGTVFHHPEPCHAEYQLKRYTRSFYPFPDILSNPFFPSNPTRLDRSHRLLLYPFSALWRPALLAIYYEQLFSFCWAVGLWETVPNRFRPSISTISVTSTNMACIHAACYTTWGKRCRKHNLNTRTPSVQII
jgi:hypothetical protein